MPGFVLLDLLEIGARAKISSCVPDLSRGVCSSGKICDMVEVEVPHLLENSYEHADSFDNNVTRTSTAGDIE